MESLPARQRQSHREKQHCTTIDSPSAAAAISISLKSSAAIADGSSPVHQQPKETNPALLDHDGDVNTALITPIKATEQQKQGKRKQLQLQLALVHKPERGKNVRTKSTVVLKKKATEIAQEGVRTKPCSGAPLKWPPVSSVKSLPPLAGRMADLVKEDTDIGFTKNNTIEFEVNQECTSIALVPSGRLAIAGFTDGTLRLFDLTGTFARDKNDPRNPTSLDSFEFDDDASTDASEDEMSPKRGRRSINGEVCSHVNQRFGVVACQIHARGVHTSLLMDVAVSEDGLYAFGGVQRGSVELVAVHLGEVENYLDEKFPGEGGTRNRQEHEKQPEDSIVGLLDLVRVDRHADAKLKGFGAVARLWNGWERARGGDRPEYLLFTGKGIKNIHIWSFKPSRLENGEEEESIWTCLYDTQTNGTSICQLYFRHNARGLQGISKSDDQKLRVWDLSWEEKRVAKGLTGKDRPKRPDYVDVTSTDTTVGVCGNYAFALSAASEAIINLIPLDAEDVSSPFNVTELALPMTDGAVDNAVANRTSRSGRQQRGELKSVVNVCGLVYDSSHALLNLSDGSMVHFSHDESGHPVLVPCSPSLSKTSIDPGIQCMSFGMPVAPNQNKKMCIARVGAEGLVTLAVSSYNENASRGALMLRALPVGGHSHNANKSFKFWGFNGLKRKRRLSSLRILVAKNKSEINTGELTPSMNVIPLQRSPVLEEKVYNGRQPPATPMLEAKVTHLKKPVATVMPTPKETCAITLSRPTTPSVVNTTTTLQVSHNSDKSLVKRIPTLFHEPTKPESMDYQLETLVDQCVKDALDTPAKLNESDVEKSPNKDLESDKILMTPKESPEPLVKKQKFLNTSESDTRRGSVTSVEKAAPATPRKVPRKKTWSSPRRTSPSNDFNEPVTEGMSPTPPVDIINVHHLGVTLFERKEEPELPESCFHPKQRPMLLAEKCTHDTVSTRLIAFDSKESPHQSMEISSNPTLAKHDSERRKLAAKHRAEHEMLRRQVLNTIRYVISTWDIELNSNRSYTSVLESTKRWFDDALSDHQQTLTDMMDRQILEAESLAARQTLELIGRRAPTLQVSFPFPEVFEQARTELLSHFKV
eukprot:CCRYP_008733-RB/>CCRYP_008733-RB protein AED:0.03 eAED:0.03 QI:381/1/1/1/1/0.83/6/3101/1099